MLINEENYVDKAEKAIKTLAEQSKDWKGKIRMLTTSQIRNLLAMSADIYNEVMNEVTESGDQLSPEIRGRINYLKIRFVYEAGREGGKERKVKDFIRTTDILNVLDSVQGSRKNFLLFNRYMEALVAFHRYYGGND